MTTTLEPPISTSLPPTLERMNGHAATTAASRRAVVTPMSRRVAKIGLLGLRLAIGFEFLWAFLDKTFGLGYHTSNAKAWIHGGSPTTGFLSGVSVGPLQGTFHSLAGVTAVDWLFMLGLLGVGVALILGVALRPAAISGCTMLAMMYVASWPFAKMAGGVPTAFDQPDRRRPRRQLHGARRDRRVRRTQRRRDQPPLVRTRIRAVALLAPIAVTARRHLRRSIMKALVYHGPGKQGLGRSRQARRSR